MERREKFAAPTGLYPLARARDGNEMAATVLRLGTFVGR